MAGVVVIVTAGRTGRSKGMVHRASGVYEFASRNLKARRRGKHIRGRCIATDEGYIELALPTISPAARTIWARDALERARAFFDIAVHEWGYIRDHQADAAPGFHAVHSWAKRGPSGRRGKWENRPEERRAIYYAAEVKERIADGVVQSPESEILDLAVWLDQ